MAVARRIKIAKAMAKTESGQAQWN